MPSPALDAWLTLLRAPGLSTGLFTRLLAAHGDAPAVLAAIRRGRPFESLSPSTRAWLRDPDAECLATDRAWLAQPGHHLLCRGDADFPPQLEQIASPPMALFVAGDPALLLHPQIAIVGARNASAGGLAIARSFARHLAAAGLMVTSGMAEGIDAAAHGAALDARAPTLAVLGTGPDIVYPRKHQALAARIESQGALISEFAPGTGARAAHFPQRNRIIAGLSLGTLVVEASLRSGSLITARLAADQGREVFAVPGSIHHPLARGCHRMIQQGAKLVETAEDVLEELAPLARSQGQALAARLDETAGSSAAPESSAAPRELDPQYGRVLEALGHDPVAVDTLVSRSGMSAAEISSMLLILELEGRVSAVSGGRYRRN